MNASDNLTEQKLIEEFAYQGSYGCTFKEFDMNKKKVKYIKKIQENTNSATNEIEIGEEIRKIKKYRQHFAPILKSSSITLGQVNDDELKKCTLIDESSTGALKKYVTSMISYAGDYTLGDYIYHTFKKFPKRFLRTFFGCYFDVLFSISLLNKANIIHLDLKENNIIYNEHLGKPIVIDFGLSFNTSKLTPEKYKNVFFTYGYDYPPWCFEISVISYAVNEIEDINTDILSAEHIEKLCHNFIYINPLFIENDGNEIFKEEERQEYKIKLKNYLKQFENQTFTQVINEQLTTTDTWDIYATHVIFLTLAHNLHIADYNNDEYPFIKKFLNTLKQEVIAIPSERKKYVDISSIVTKEFELSERKHVNTVIEKVDLHASDEQNIIQIKKKLAKLQLKDLKKEKDVNSLQAAI
jgi:serine/threonine protein kinase